MGPAYRLLLRERADALRPDHGLESGPETTCVVLETALKVTPSPASAEEIDSLLRAFAVEIPDALLRAIGMRPELLGRAGPGVVEPLGVLPGMIFAAATRALYAARVMWFQAIDCIRMSRLLQGMPPAPLSLKVSE